MMDKVRLKGHESFSIREGWLSKGISAVVDNSKIFSSKEATDILGIGTNMVKSLKYWLITCNLIEEDKKNGYKLTTLGELVYKYDLYMEEMFTLYFIHLQIVLNKERALIWNLFFNKCNSRIFTKKDILEQMEYELESSNLEYNEKILVDEINVLIKTYVLDEKVDNPENNLSCPLTELKLLKKIDRDLYEKNKTGISNLDFRIVYYMILNFCLDTKSINIEDLLKKDDSVAKLLNLDKVTLNEYIEELRREKLIVVNKTAGINMLYIDKEYSLNEIFEQYFGKEG